MRTFLIAVSFLAGTAAVAQEQKPIDPAETVKQLYSLSTRSWSGAASYEIWGDGSVHFSVEVAQGTLTSSRIRIDGTGRTAEAALSDLKAKSETIAEGLVPEAEKKKQSVLSMIEGLKAILFGDRRSQ